MIYLICESDFQGKTNQLMVFLFFPGCRKSTSNYSSYSSNIITTCGTWLTMCKTVHYLIPPTHFESPSTLVNYDDDVSRNAVDADYLLSTGFSMLQSRARCTKTICISVNKHQLMECCVHVTSSKITNTNKLKETPSD